MERSSPSERSGWCIAITTSLVERPWSIFLSEAGRDPQGFNSITFEPFLVGSMYLGFRLVVFFRGFTCLLWMTGNFRPEFLFKGDL